MTLLFEIRDGISAPAHIADIGIQILYLNTLQLANTKKCGPEGSMDRPGKLYSPSSESYIIHYLVRMSHVK